MSSSTKLEFFSTRYFLPQADLSLSTFLKWICFPKVFPQPLSEVLFSEIFSNILTICFENVGMRSGCGILTAVSSAIHEPKNLLVPICYCFFFYCFYCDHTSSLVAFWGSNTQPLFALRTSLLSESIYTSSTSRPFSACPVVLNTKQG